MMVLGVQDIGIQVVEEELAVKAKVIQDHTADQELQTI